VQEKRKGESMPKSKKKNKKVKAQVAAEKPKAKKSWSGRFSEETNKLVEKFTSSLVCDARLFDYDIKQNSVYAKALKVIGILNDKECKQIINELKEIAAHYKVGKITLNDVLEDVHMNIEYTLIERVGDLGKKIHTGRSRNDQVITDLRLYLKDEINTTLLRIKKFEETIVDLSEKNLDVIMSGYTHLQHAQPILLSHHLMAYYEMLERDRERFKECLKRTDVLPLGSGAMAGSSFPIDREYIAKELGFATISKNSIDAVSDRDFVVDFIYCAAVTMMHISRLCEELILWSTTEFNFIEFSDSFSTGSSIMPQKKNPDIAELIRGRTGRAFGNLVSVMTMLKALPMSYNRDLQEDKHDLFDCVDNLAASLEIISEVLKNIKINKDVMRQSAIEGYTTAADLVDYIVKKGMPFREAHRVVGRIVAYCIVEKKQLSGLNVLEFKRFYGKIDDDVFESISVENSLKTKNVVGGTAPRRVRDAVKEAKEKLKK